MALLDLLSRRPALRVLWELRTDTLRFRDLQARAEASPSVLNTRLAELREAAIVDLGEAGYRLTPLGRELLAQFGPLSKWAERWAQTLSERGDDD